MDPRGSKDLRSPSPINSNVICYKNGSNTEILKTFFTNKLTINLKTKFESRLNFLPRQTKVGHIKKDNAYLAYRLTVSFWGKRLNKRSTVNTFSNRRKGYIGPLRKSHILRL